jgi:hypothetical protein
LSNGQVISWVYECTKDKDGKWDCHDLTRVNAVPPALKAEIDATLKEEVQSNTNDRKDLGHLRSDGLTDLGTQQRKAGQDPLEYLNNTDLAP